MNHWTTTERRNVSLVVEHRVLDGRPFVVIVIGEGDGQSTSFLDAANALALADQLREVAAFVAKRGGP